jgi:signal transduction histidine kinase
MEITAPCPFASTLAARLRDARYELTARWLERITARVALDPNRVFPTDELLDHMPMLLLGVADYLESPGDHLVANETVVSKAMELGELRHAQGFDAYEILKEFEILGGVLFAFFTRAVDEAGLPAGSGDLLVCAHRLFHGIAAIQQATTVKFLQRSNAHLHERESRLRAFNRAITHELKNQLHVALGASQALDVAGPLTDDQRRLASVTLKNLRDMQARLEDLLELTRLESDARQQRHVLLRQAVAEVIRQLREAAAMNNVEIRCADLPAVEVHAAAVELCLTNYLSNAIKYADPDKAHRWVEISAAMDDHRDGGSDLVVRVRDNGRGVPEALRSNLFNRFMRVDEHESSGVEGTGLGLSIVRDTMEALGGRAWAEFPRDESVFAFALPSRRVSDGTPGATQPATTNRS